MHSILIWSWWRAGGQIDHWIKFLRRLDTSFEFIWHHLTRFPAAMTSPGTSSLGMHQRHRAYASS
jgi:hypothetical protein